jgi:hypothetical protein
MWWSTEVASRDLGWLNPLDAHGVRPPRIDGSSANPTRVCEIWQLEGVALE